MATQTHQIRSQMSSGTMFSSAMLALVRPVWIRTQSNETFERPISQKISGLRVYDALVTAWRSNGKMTYLVTERNTHRSTIRMYCGSVNQATNYLINCIGRCLCGIGR